MEKLTGIDAVTLATYIAIVFGFVFIPGSATLLTVARSSTSGTRAGMATSLGIAVGDVIHTAMAVVGISAIIYASAFMFSLIKNLGAAYLLYLGIQTIMAKVPEPSGNKQAVPLTPRCLQSGNRNRVAQPENGSVLSCFLASIREARKRSYHAAANCISLAQHMAGL